MVARGTAQGGDVGQYSRSRSGRARAVCHDKRLQGDSLGSDTAGLSR